jgi:hypothetical protein
MRSLTVERRLDSNETPRSLSHGFLRALEWGWLVLLVVALMVPCAMAQLSGKGAITGTVTDKNGAVIPDAVVTATNDATNIATKKTTNDAGNYTFSNLDPGIYTINTTAKGFEQLVQKNVHVNAMEMQTYNPVLVVGGGSVEIVVTDQPPQLETSNATLGSTMEQESYSELPVEMGAYGQADQRRATDFVFLMPGVQGNNTNGNATTNTGVINGSGSRGAASAVYIDGVPFVRAAGNGDPRYVWTAISVDAIDQFQVHTTGYPALYEGQGVMNYTVKAGGVQYHGSLYEFFRNTALDTWGFWGKAVNTVTGVATKPVEHSNEYGINLSGQLIPIGSLKGKLFFFENYNGFRYASENPTPITFPTAAEQAGDFSATGIDIYDPTENVSTCTGNNKQTINCRAQFESDGVKNVIPSDRISSIAQKMQSFLPSDIGTSVKNNYIAANSTGLNNWSTTSRIDYVISPQDSLSIIGAVGRQASSVPVGQATSGRNVGPVPYNYGQAYAPKTDVGIIEETHIFNPNLINQIKFGVARYNGPTFTPNYTTAYSALTMGITGAPVGQATGAFPITKFSGSDAPTQWGGTTATSSIANNYTFLDNLQWNHGKHSITFGGQVAWMQYNSDSGTGGSTPITLQTTYTETAQFNKSNKSTSVYTVDSSTGLAYASFLLGQIDKGSFTDYTYHEGYGARFRAISPYFQDDWKVTPKLTVNFGVRYDFFPTVREVHNMASFFNPDMTNSVTGLSGALQFAGYGGSNCNCATPVNNYHKNVGPRLGLAYQLDSKTVIRASYGLMYTHGDAVGGLAYTLGNLGFSSSPSFSSNNSVTTMTDFLVNGSGALPSYTSASGFSSGNGYGTGYTTTSGYTGSPSSINYDDPYYGSRAPQYHNWSFGIQRELNKSIVLTASYVGSEGHFLQLDKYNARGKWSNALDPKYLSLGTTLAVTGSSIATACTENNLDCTGLSIWNTKYALSSLLKPFPFQSISDSFGYVGNSNYHALQAVLNIRNWHGLTTNVNYTWSRTIDDGGTFRSGYTIPTAYIYNYSGTASSVSNTRIERTVSTSNQPHHFVVSSVWHAPFGKTVFAESRTSRMLLGGYTLSGIFQAYSGSPLAIIASSCNVNPAQNVCMPSYNPDFTGKARINGHWGKGVTTANYTSKSFIDSDAFVQTADYYFGNTPRTAPYNIYGPGNYQLDLSLSRSFPLHFTSTAKLDFKAQWYNVTNHTFFGVSSVDWGDSDFGMVTSNSAANRKAAQFTARVSF